MVTGLVYILLNKNSSGPTDTAAVLTHTDDTPSEAPIDPEYSVSASQPLSIEIPSVAIKGFIQKVGVDQNRQITAPNNINLAGWFVDSVLPGKKGLSIIGGHVDGYSKKGIFHSLKDVKNGDEVVVSFGDNSTRKFTVFATKSVKVDDAAKYLFNQDPSVTSQLNIITCTGKYDSSIHGYQDRFIVFASLSS
jgi:LPXTG-site transpeptidase (sortase) family protein